MAYEVKITDEAALKIAQPDLFSVNLRLLKKRLVAAKTLGQTIQGAELVKVEKIEEPVAPVESPTRSFIAEREAKDAA